MLQLSCDLVGILAVHVALWKWACVMGTLIFIVQHSASIWQLCYHLSVECEVSNTWLSLCVTTNEISARNIFTIQCNSSNRFHIFLMK